MNATLYRPRRRIEQRNAKGDVIGVLETTLSDAELAERDRVCVGHVMRQLGSR
jgi:hypothetical protein